MYLVTDLMANARTCLNENLTPDYFGCEPPSLVEYFVWMDHCTIVNNRICLFQAHRPIYRLPFFVNPILVFFFCGGSDPMDFGIKLWGDNGNQERYYVHVLGLEVFAFICNY